jgi:ATP-binding cassette, subfamily B (MDR/TAP), member 1
MRFHCPTYPLLYLSLTGLGSYALAFWAGALFIQDGLMARVELLRVFLAVTLTAQALGRISSLSPDTARARAAARNVFKIIDAAPAEPQSGPHSRSTVVPFQQFAANAPPSLAQKGVIEFRGVTFAYPTRQDAPALKDFSLCIARGATVALCGESGSGKSTVVALLERFYEPQAGEIPR